MRLHLSIMIVHFERTVTIVQQDSVILMKVQRISFTPWRDNIVNIFQDSFYQLFMLLQEQDQKVYPQQIMAHPMATPSCSPFLSCSLVLLQHMLRFSEHTDSFIPMDSFWWCYFSLVIDMIVPVHRVLNIEFP